MACERRFNCGVSRFLVAGLADEQHVGILPKKRTEDIRERQPDLGVRLNLRDARQVVFDRVLRRRNIHPRLVDLGERGVKRRRLAGSGRARHVNDAVGLIDHLADECERRRMRDQLVEPERRVRLVEDAHADLLAPFARHGGDAKINRLPFHRHADPAVLREALLGDIELAQNLEARDEPELDFLR